MKKNIFSSVNGFWRKMIKNVMTIITGSTVSSICDMISIVIILRLLSQNDYGSFVVAQTYMGVIDTVVNFQSWQGVIRYGSLAINEKNEDKFFATIKAGMLIDGATCIMGVIIGFGMLHIVASLFSWTEVIINICRFFIIEMLFHLEGTIVGFFKLVDKFKYLAIYTGWTGFLRLIVVIILYTINVRDVIIFSKIIVISDIIKYISLIIVAAVVFNKMYGIKKLFLANVKNVEKSFWKFTFWSNLDSSVDVPIKYFDIFFLSLISNEIVAAYNLYKKYMSAFEMLISPISQTIMPQFAELIARGKKKEAYYKMKKLRNIIFILMIPLQMLFIFLLPFVMRRLGQGSYLEYYYIIYALALYYTCTLSYVGIHPLFSAYGFSKESTKITLIANIAYTITAMILLDKFQIIGIIIAQFVQFNIYIVWKQKYIKKEVFN